MHKAIALISKCLLRSRKQQIIVSLFIALPAIYMLAAPHSAQTDVTRMAIRAFGCIFILSAAIIFYSAYRHFTPTNSKLISILKHNPRQIVWVYSVLARLMPFGIHLFNSATVFFMLKDGRYHTIRLKENELQPLMNGLKQSLPDTSFGYTLKKEQLYRADPEMLGKD